MKKYQLLFLIPILLICTNATAQDFNLDNKIIASDRESVDYFGQHEAVSIYGEFAVVGAYGADNVPPPGGAMSNSGAVYVYKWDDINCLWLETDIITAESAIDTPDEHAGDVFGESVSIFGNVVVVGAASVDFAGHPSAGMVYVYELSPSGISTFKERLYPFHNDGPMTDFDDFGRFGMSVKIHEDRIVVGAILEDDNDDGVSPIVNAGAAYIYKYSYGADSYLFEQKITAPDRAISDHFGNSVSIFGEFVVIGTEDENDEVAGLGNSGAVYVFRYNSVTFEWDFWQKLEAPVKSSNDNFGCAVDITQGTIVVGAYYEDHNEVDDPAAILTLGEAGSVYIYALDYPFFNFQQKIVPLDRAEDDFFGIDVSIHGNRIVVGASGQDFNAVGGDELNSPGAAYVFEFGASWTQVQKIDAFDREDGDSFGRSVCISNNDNIIITAPFEDHDETGGGATLPAAGSAYIFGFNDLPEITTVSSTGLSCAGEEVTLTVTGSLGDAEDWVWYEGSCDGLFVGTGASIIVSPDVATTYCVRGEGGCINLDDSECVCTTVEVIPVNWHQSTDEGVFDKANDIITDTSGNVYITGEYFDHTTFDGGINPNETISSGAADIKSYTAKYDNCGNLLWVAWSDNMVIDHHDYGTSITLDENNGLVYVAGDFRNVIHYNGAIGIDGALSPLDFSTFGSGEQGYVACFNMSDGDINYINAVTLDPITRLDAITINENNGRIYIGGERSLSSAGTKAFVQRYSPTGSGIGSPNWLINGSAYAYEYVNDLDYDEDDGDDGSLWIIGDYEFTISFTPGTTTLASNYKDAYIARYKDDDVIPTEVFLQMGNVNGEMHGNGVAVDKTTGNAYFTGHYSGVATAAFQMSGQNLPANIYQHAYFMAMDGNGNPIWPIAHHTFGSPAVAVNGYSVAYTNNTAYFTGTYADNTIWFSGGPPLNYFSGSNDEPHVYVLAYDAITSNYLWNNATVDLSGLAKHIPSAITTDHLGHAFISGGYSQMMDYLLGAPSSGVLNTTAQFETFVMRVDLDVFGALEFTLQDDEIAFTTIDSKISSQTAGINLEENDSNGLPFVLMPNPADESTLLELTNYEANQTYGLKIFSIEGKLVVETAIDAQQTRLNLSDLESGVYFILVSNNKGYQSTRKLIIR